MHKSIEKINYSDVDKFTIINIIDHKTKNNRIKSTKYLKRSFDILFSLFVIVFFLSWIIPIIAILIKLESKGSPFFLQKRIGFKGKIFTCIKLRTMRINDESNEEVAFENELRITRVGKILRKTGLDELPQFLNVIFGQMSIVGPRPFMISEYSQLVSIFPNFSNRNLVKPGITGLAEINGYRGFKDTVDEIKARLNLDLFYVYNYSFLLDTKIIINTIPSILISLLNFKGQFIFPKSERAAA